MIQSWPPWGQHLIRLFRNIQHPFCPDGGFSCDAYGNETTIHALLGLQKGHLLRADLCSGQAEAPTDVLTPEISVVVTEIGMIYVTRQTNSLLPSDLIRDTSIASIALTVFNFLAAVSAIALILFDNRRIYKTWKIAPSNRIPLALSIAICISHVVFILKALIGIAVFQGLDPPNNTKLHCKVLNELGFWAIWPPLVTIVVRTIVTVFGISFRFNTYGIRTEGFTIFLTAIISFVVYIPVFVIPPGSHCVPFVFNLLGNHQPELAVAAVIIISTLLLLLTMGMLIVGFDTAMLKRNLASSGGSDVDSVDLYVQDRHRQNPDRKLIYFGVGLLLLYVVLIPEFVFSSLKIINIPLSFVASVALHLDGLVLLLQYIFGHRSQRDPCACCAKPWHSIDDQDSLHQPLAISTDKWGRRSFVNGRDAVSATVTAPTLDTPKVFSTVVTDEARSSVQAGRISGWSAPRPSMRQTELPDKVFLPRLSTRTEDQYGLRTPTNRGSMAAYSTRSALSHSARQVRPPYANQFRQSKQSVASSQGTIERIPAIAITPSPRVAQVGSRTSSINSSGNPVKRENTQMPIISLSMRSLPPPKPVDPPSTPKPSPLSTILENGTVRKKTSETATLWPLPDPKTTKLPVTDFSKIPAQFEKRVSIIQPPQTPSARYYI